MVACNDSFAINVPWRDGFISDFAIMMMSHPTLRGSLMAEQVGRHSFSTNYVEFVLQELANQKSTTVKPNKR